MTGAERVDVAVVGVGAMGSNHVRVLNEIDGARVVAVVDPDPARAGLASQRTRADAFRSVEDMLRAVTPRAVIVAVPIRDHFATARTLLANGCDVLVEKPIAATVDEGHQLIESAEVAGRVLMVGHVERFNPAVIELTKLVREGAVGRVFVMSARRLGPFPERVRDAGVVIDLATHDIDIMNMLAGGRVRSVYAQTRRRLHTRFEDLFVGIIHYEADVLGALEVNWLTPTKVRELWVTGEGGLFRLDYLTQDLYLHENGAVPVREQWSPLDVIRGISESRMIKPAVRKREPLRAELEAFLEAVRAHDTSNAGARDALHALDIALRLVEVAGRTPAETIA